MIGEITIGCQEICAGHGDYRKMYFLGKKDGFGFVESLTKDELEHVLKMLNEREREEKYEYAEESAIDGGLYFVYHHRTDSLAYAKEAQSRDTKLVRRPVGEWEEVRNAE